MIRIVFGISLMMVWAQGTKVNLSKGLFRGAMK